MNDAIYSNTRYPIVQGFNLAKETGLPVEMEVNEGKLIVEHCPDGPGFNCGTFRLVHLLRVGDYTYRQVRKIQERLAISHLVDGWHRAFLETVRRGA